jgi:hypothetical protein
MLARETKLRAAEEQVLAEAELRAKVTAFWVTTAAWKCRCCSTGDLRRITSEPKLEHPALLVVHLRTECVCCNDRQTLLPLTVDLDDPMLALRDLARKACK